MLYGLYTSAAGALANSYRQDVIANNLANTETVSFKEDLALLQGRRTEAQTGGQRSHTTAILEGIGGGLFALPTHTDFSPGPLNHTGSPHDLALTKKGFFPVRQGNEILYTRDGRITFDANNHLVTAASKLPLLDEGGEAITIDPEMGEIVVNENGLISQSGNVIAKIGVVDFTDTKVLAKQGKGLYAVEGNARPIPVDGGIQQRVLEGSTVNALDQMVKMIKAQRLFQANVNMMKIQDQTLGMSVSRLGQINV